MAPQKRLYILLSVCLALFLSLAIYYGMIFFLVNPYIENTDKLPNIFNLYTEKTGDSASKVYILGSSQVREDVNASVIRELWQEKNVSADVFNLGYTGDTPLRRLTELQAMKKSHPDLVIVGVSYQSFSENGSIPYEQLLIVADKISLDNTSQTLYTPDELHWMSLNFFENGYEKRTWIVPAIEGIFLRDNQDIAESHNFNDPFIYTVNQTDKELEEKLRDHPEEQQVYITFPRENNRQKTALTYFVRELQDGGTKVAIVIMPLNPLLEPTVNETNSQGMREFLNTLGVPVVDLESAYGRSDFIDFVHMNSAGREEFSRTLAEDILPD